MRAHRIGLGTLVGTLSGCALAHDPAVMVIVSGLTAAAASQLADAIREGGGLLLDTIRVARARRRVQLAQLEAASPPAQGK